MKKTATGSSLARFASWRVILAATATILTQPAGATCPSSIQSADGLQPGLPENSEDFVVRDIYIANGDVFDLDNSQYDGFLHRWMNNLHMQTDEAVIRRQLLFVEGETIDEESLAETERYLRANRYLAEAEVSRVNCEHGVADIEVKTADTWSLMPSISFSRKGGQNFGGAEIQETNLLGTGTELKLVYDSDVERDLLGVRYADRQLGDSRTGIFVSLEDYDDGYRYGLNLGQPFYSLNARRAAGIELSVFDQVDDIVEMGEPVAEVRHSAREFIGHMGWSRGLYKGRVVRWNVGIGYDEHQFQSLDALPVSRSIANDRRDVFPFIGVEWLENKYEEARNQDQMARVEDRHLGTRLSLQLGLAAKLLGSLQNALRLDAAASRGFHPVPGDTLMLSSELNWRRPQSGGSTSYLLQAGAKYYHQQSERRMFFAQLNVATGRNLDSDQQLYLGGDSGLRGYPVRYLNGDTTALLTLEQRVHTDWYPFGLFRVGAAAFLDAGKAWGNSGQDASLSGTLMNAGIGLRIGSPHSSTGRMMHIDAAYALDGPTAVQGWQLFLGSRTNF